MKALKKIALVGAVIVALVALLLALALIPAVQTWAVRKAVASQPGGLKLDVSRVAAGFKSADLRDVRMVKDGIVITAKQVNARYSAWDYLTRDRITVHELSVDDLLVDMRTSASAQPTTQSGSGNAQPRQNAGSAEPTEPFNGLLNQAKIPYDLQIARFAVPGRALLPGDKTATFEIRGSDITTGRRGTIDWKVDLDNAAQGAPFRVLRSTGTAGVHITTERRIDVADVNAVASVEGPKLPSDQVKLEAKIEQPAAGGNEGYTAHVSLVRGSNVEQLLTLAGQYDASARQIGGAWNASVRSDQVSALLSGFGLPDVSVTGAGKFTAKPDAAAVTASGDLQSDLTRLEKISPDLATIGSLRVQTRFDGAYADNTASLAHFSLDATAANGRKLAQINALQRIAFSTETKRVSFADPKADLARVSIQAFPLAWAQPFAKGVTIDDGEMSLVLAIAADADGSRVRVTSTEPLTARNVTVRSGDTKLVDRLELSARPQAEYSADRLHAELNELALSMPAGDRVTGRLVADVTQLSTAPQVAFTSETQAQIVAALKPYLPVQTGPLTIASRSEGTFAGSTVHVVRATTEVSRSSGPLLSAIEVLQPLMLDLQAGMPRVAKPEADAIRIRLGTVPLSWMEAFVPNSKLGGELNGGSVTIKLLGKDAVEASTPQPIAMRGFSATMNGKPMAQNVDVAVDFTAAKQGNAIRYNVRRFEARQGAASLVTLVASGEATLGDKFALTSKGSLESDLGAAMQQPLFAGSATLARGRVNATFDATIKDAIAAKAALSARGLVAKEGNVQLGDAELSLDASVQPDGSSIVNVPFTLTNANRKSDLLVEGKLARNDTGMTFDGRIRSSQLFVDDLKPLAGLAPSSPNTGAPAQQPGSRTAQPTPTVTTTGGAQPGQPRQGTPTGTATATPTKDAHPFWTGVGGSIEMDLRQIIYGRDYVIDGVRGSAVIAPRQLALRTLEGRLKQNPFKVTASVDFDATQEQPYTLSAGANVTNLAVGEILRAANPNERPQLETNVSVDAKLSGRGATLQKLLLGTYGTFDATGSNGVLRALGRKGGQAASVGSALLGIAGAMRGSDTTVAVSELTAKLTELPFERFSMHAERGADLNIKIGRIEFLSPDTRLLGNGEVVRQPGVPIQNQPLKITFTLAGKDAMAQLLRRTGALSDKQDELGYYPMSTSFTLTGTPSSTNSGDLWRIILESAAKAAAGRFLGQ